MTLRSLSGLVALAGATLLAVACAGSEESTFGVDCVPGSQTVCDCPDGTTGVQVCQSDGTSLGDCQCAPPAPEGGAGSGGSGGAPQASCTLYPDCSGCEGCWATCVCNSKGDVKGCKQTCLVDGGSSSNTDAGGSCDVASCPPATGIGAQFATACCTSANNCGLSISLIAGSGCQEKNQPGTPNASCPTMSLMGFNLNGCCRPDHTCGLQDPILGLGCVDPTAFGQPKGPSC